ncbi:MAG: hypothetical protein C7B45_05665 [Sulfobacillus acidophilus]|uniref:Core-binding (CB) domain-containing protein n=1 Tax=Sulfobacillus acidophilus TaxID=53633 RepID=A0A2T2WKC2_9FIRM|nr:MAG: hypothetical protein C7B45_05665 [Sulfobacillus acidophilus]
MPCRISPPIWVIRIFGARSITSALRPRCIRISSYSGRPRWDPSFPKEGIPLKTPTDFARHLSTFLTQYLPGQKNVSPHTIAAYRDTWKLFLIFSEQYDGVGPERLTLAKLTKDRVLAYLEWLETVRHCSAATRN